MGIKPGPKPKTKSTGKPDRRRMNIGENEFRDFLFANHKQDISTLIAGRRDAVIWTGDEFPPLSFLLQQKTEIKINEILDSIEGTFRTSICE